MSRAYILKILSVFHLTLAGLTALFSCLSLIQFLLGLMLVTSAGAIGSPDDIPMSIFGLMFIVGSNLSVLIGWTLAICVFIAASQISKARCRAYCLIIAAIECVLVPLGPIIGIVTIIILLNKKTKSLFDQPIPSV